jgi:hypothetical protein
MRKIIVGAQGSMGGVLHAPGGPTDGALDAPSEREIAGQERMKREG